MFVNKLYGYINPATTVEDWKKRLGRRVLVCEQEMAWEDRKPIGLTDVGLTYEEATVVEVATTRVKLEFVLHRGTDWWQFHTFRIVEALE